MPAKLSPRAAGAGPAHDTAWDGAEPPAPARRRGPSRMLVPGVVSKCVLSGYVHATAVYVSEVQVVRFGFVLPRLPVAVDRERLKTAAAGAHSGHSARTTREYTRDKNTHNLIQFLTEKLLKAYVAPLRPPPKKGTFAHALPAARPRARPGHGGPGGQLKRAGADPTVHIAPSLHIM